MAAPSGAGGSVTLHYEGSVAVITMRRGENRINRDYISQMNARLDEVLRNPDCRVLATTGEGKFYGNGMDLEWMMGLATKDKNSFETFGFEEVPEFWVRLLTFPLPTVALINGHAFAGGAVTSLCHDHVIMNSDRGWWCLNEVHINLPFPPYLLELFRMKLSAQALTAAVALGERYTGPEALAAGVVQEAVPARDLLPRALTWATTRLPANGYNTEHLQVMKEDLFRPVLQTVAKQREDRGGPENIKKSKI